MSILPYFPLAAAADGAPLSWLLIVSTALAVGAAFVSGVLPPGKLPGPARIPADRSSWPLAGVSLGAMAMFLLASAAIMSIWSALAPRYGATTQPLESDSGVALLSTFPTVFGTLGLLAGDYVIADGVHQSLGLRLSKVFRGILFGLAGAALVLPPLYLSSQIFEWLYHSIHYEHPAEHPLLHILGEGPSPLIKAIIIIGACTIAPFGEEYFFRGHIQTLILRTVQWLVLRQTGREPLQLLPSRPPTFEIQNGGQMPPPKAWMSWAAILMTSVIFASIHPTWSAPIIFILAVFLGYAYERTGNLWVSITMHAMFNIVSTVLFLAGAGSH